MAEGVKKLNKLLADPHTTEIMINGLNAVFVEKDGKTHKLDLKFSQEELQEVIDQFFIKNGKIVSEHHPYADVCLQDGSRLNIILYPMARCGTTITIRKFSQEIKSLEDLLEKNSLSKNMANFLTSCIKGKLNILFSGATGTGKTTTLEMLSYSIPKDERIVTIEDTAELQLHQPNLVPLETRDPDEEGKGGVALKDLIKNALRMRPDRIILGEVRGEEALDMVQAMATGHTGTLAVVHGSSPKDILGRIETMVLSSGIKLPLEEIRKMLASTLDIVVQHQRFTDGTRKITSITEVRGMDQQEISLQDLFVFRREGKTEDGKIKGTYKTAMKRYPKFFTDMRRMNLIDDKIFSD
ncbi:MAG: Flp pilus assembly complex ATPase component TadA [Candidatus Omnitrophica bacterium]|nr:Flp pilus assembly complex ATPase component TadA [Candidatus Omnitrophota bacterium]